MMPTFKIVEHKGETGIQCLLCELISYNSNDIAYKYCDFCKIFHDDLSDMERRDEAMFKRYCEALKRRRKKYLES